MYEMQFSLLVSNDETMKIYFHKKIIIPVVIFMKVKRITCICWETFPFKYKNVCVFCLIWFFTSQWTIFQLHQDESSRVEPVQI